MSYVTDIVFVTADQADAERFVEIIHTHYADDVDIVPLEPSYAREDSKTTVYHLNLNWAGEIVAHLQLEQWRSQCVLWTKVETSEPSVEHFAPEPPPPRRRRNYASGELADLERQAIAAGIIKPLSDQPPRPDDEEEEEFDPE